ncbi:MAG: RNA methyltransferase, partial [Defluviicoccus sp.]
MSGMAGGAGELISSIGGTPAVVLVEPQLAENIGMVARAMLNCGLDDLRLVRPRAGWP